jgi:Gpi18-like mannosyltransferase
MSHPYDMASWIVRAEWAYIFDFNPLYHARNGIFEVGARLLGYPVHIMSSLLDFGSILTLQLALKLPYIIADTGIAVLLYRIMQFKTKNQSIGCLLCFAWLVNPFAIFTSSIHGAPDPLPVFFTLLAIYFLLENKPMHSFIGLSIAACLRYYALFLFPLFAFYFWRESSLREKLFSTVSSIIVAVTNFAPVVFDPILRGQLFRSVTFYSTGTIQITSKPWSLWHYFITSGILTHSFILKYLFWLSFIPAYVLMTIFIYYDYKKQKLDDSRALEYTAIILLLIPLLNPFSDPQWLLWALPFLMYLSIIANRRLSPLVSILWALNLTILVFNWDTHPTRYLITAYPQASQYQMPHMDCLATTFSIPYAIITNDHFYSINQKKTNYGKHKIT